MGVKLKGDLDYTIELPAKAAEAIKPGMLIAVSAGEFIKHATAEGNAAPIYADAPVNAAETAAIPDAQNVVGLVNPQKVKAILDQNQTIVVGDFLESATAAGTLQKHVPQAVDEALTNQYNVLEKAIVGMALEAVSTGGSENKDILVGRV